MRFLYAKSFVDSGTNFRVAGYRYSTSGYRTFEEAMDMQALQPSETLHSRRNELRFEVAQQIGDWGSLFASARQQSYWDTRTKDRLVQFGWSGNYKQFGYNVFYNRSVYQDRRATSQLMFTLSIPLGGATPMRSTRCRAIGKAAAPSRLASTAPCWRIAASTTA